jgi:hypothetical protein
MISVNVKGMAEMQSALRNLAKEQLPYAMATAINRTAFSVRGALQTEMKSVFQNPTPWIQRSIRYDKATKDNLEARVYHHEEGAKSIISEVRGGQREVKPYERLMRSAGILPAGRLVVPGAACRLDRYGNVDRDVMSAILKGLGLLSAKMQADRKLGKKRQRALNQSGTYFVGGQGLARHLAPGIWQRVGGRPRPILLFVTRSVYEKRYQFDVIGEREVRKVFADEMAKAVQRAIDTAR